MSSLTPAMRQYLEIKARYPDCILFFRMGDFYEMFFEDAVLASKLLDITLTSRDKGKEDSVPLCGFPWHAASSYIARLIAKGHKVAICEQMEDPRLAKGVVKREVVRVVTPGLVLDPDSLEAKQNNFLAGIALRGEAFGLAFLDVSTGEFRATELRDRAAFLDEVIRHGFREIVLEEGSRDPLLETVLSRELEGCVINRFPRDWFEPEAALAILGEHVGAESVARLEPESRPALIAAAGAVLRYVRETQKEGLGHINEITAYRSESFLVLDETAKRNLELFVTTQGGTKEGTLFHVLDETMTAMGGRRLRWWLAYPLLDAARIRDRLAAVGEIREAHLVRRDLRKALAGLYDMERLGARISLGVANGRDLAALRASLRTLPGLKALLAAFETPVLAAIREGIDEMPETLELLERAIVDEPPLALREGGIIREGFDAELDRILSIARDGKSWIAALEEKERRRTGISNLRVGFNNVFGYYIEVTKSQTGSVPADYIRKQTLVNAERYINEELKEYEQTVLHAEERRREREYDLFVQIRERVAGRIRQIQRSAAALADLDALAALAEVAEKYNYVRPAVDEGDVIEIRDGRHPVVERMPLAEGFVPNDVYMDRGANRLLVITGPNMAGKSTYIRQVAHIVILAQMGSFVPAAEARIGLVDRVFTRVGAADVLAKGQSTFMVEMTEVAHILRHATPRSLILLDEVGRGTSTFDGLSIAWAVAEHIHDAPHLGSRTLFATHYHQLTDLALTREGVANYYIAVKEWGERIIFLRRIMRGKANRSYGIQVARLAGVPDEVIARAREVLENLEKGELDEVGMPTLARGRRGARRPSAGQLSLFADEESLVLEEIASTDVDALTPLEAMNRIAQWRERLTKK
ncbi:MAG: DNA mismatch repair protein MutS [Syntrophaceae bacterium]|nr:DNA mismatch repair protein MutS [Syntrophaceae bacterium]